MEKDIAHQNKDICFKILTENYKNKSLKVYGLDLPPIKQLLPTNLPAILLDEKRADNVFLLMDNSILLLEYESVVSFKNLVKYGQYSFRIVEKYFNNQNQKIILVVIYTADVNSAPSNLDLGSIKLDFEQVFLSKFDENAMYNDLRAKVLNDQELTDEDVMKFIILPLTKKKDKQDLIEKTIDLAKSIKKEKTQEFIIAGIICVTDKFIDKEYSRNLKEWISMTKLARLYEEEKIEAIEKTREETWEKAWEESNIKRSEDIAKKMIASGSDLDFIIKITDLSRDRVLELKKLVSE